MLLRNSNLSFEISYFFYIDGRAVHKQDALHHATVLISFIWSLLLSHDDRLWFYLLFIRLSGHRSVTVAAASPILIAALRRNEMDFCTSSTTFYTFSFVVFLFDYFCLHGRTNGSSKRNMVESRNIRTLQWLFGESKSLCVKYRGDTRKLDLASASLSFSVAPFARVSFARAQNAPSRIASETYHLSGWFGS